MQEDMVFSLGTSKVTERDVELSFSKCLLHKRPEDSVCYLSGFPDFWVHSVLRPAWTSTRRLSVFPATLFFRSIMAMNFFSSPEGDSVSPESVSFRAGKCRINGNLVSPDTRKGRLQIGEGEDGLTHVRWINRENQQTEDDLIVINDAYLERVPECTTGRVYCLRFTSSDKKMLFWMQEPDASKDHALIEQFNARAGGVPAASNGDTETGASGSSASGTQQTDSGPNAQGIQQLRQLLANYSESLRRARGQPSATPLSEVLNSQTLSRVADDEETVKELVDLMPEGCRTEGDVREALRSAQLAAPMNGLTQAIYTNSSPLLSSMGVTGEDRAAATSPDAMMAFAQALEAHYRPAGEGKEAMSNEAANAAEGNPAGEEKKENEENSEQDTSGGEKKAD
ncbi:adhesion regulating molecule region protein, putative [Toxoplasma gondii ME49]|uniref:Adhesion regulating molecule region protein, putative n=3 Tax=Toxoplasma gondii TaxID=5811 RepID=S8G5J3_TOXGM|nr:adhesion regulating molecule region protein, putative [Toxoplasma gondii ME49]EPT26920.1 adhesion regulating molecule region protein, putative [Toxoplasma gondii ME49]KFG45749.1 putative adhesion regulating molecule region protein [Toxoplasma gondii GAB2-2007-GAL-DOM2]|eukprot:XP_018635926.1 adhesion regulating molecule region protein, putative [Toxoplasma gondii ME49]